MENNYIATELTKYNLSDATIAEMKAEFLPVIVKDVNDQGNYELCKEAHMKVKKLRTAIEAKRKELKSDSLAFGNAVDLEAKRLTKEILSIENHLAVQRLVVEDEKKRIAEEKARQEQEEQERIKKEEEDRLEAARKAEEERLEGIRKAQAAKEKELAEEREKVEEQKRKNEAESNRLAQEKEDAATAKQRTLEAEKAAEQEEKDRLAREERHAVEVEEAKKQAAEKAIREQKEKEEAEALRIEKEKMLAPDKEKIKVFINTLREIETPILKTSEASELISRAWGKLNDIIKYIETEASKIGVEKECNCTESTFNKEDIYKCGTCGGQLPENDERL